MSGTNLIVNYLPQYLKDVEFWQMFAAIGPVKSHSIMRDFQFVVCVAAVTGIKSICVNNSKGSDCYSTCRSIWKTGCSLGFGFVDFESLEDAQKAIEHLNGLEIGNKRIKVSYARPSSEDIKSTNLYVTKIPRTFTEDDLENVFGKYGTIIKKNILYNKITGYSLGIGFVRFEKREEAQKAISELDGHMLEGSCEPLRVKVAEEHGKQNTILQARLMMRLRQHNCFQKMLNCILSSDDHNCGFHVQRGSCRHNRNRLVTGAGARFMRRYSRPIRNNYVAYQHQHHPMRGGFTPIQGNTVAYNHLLHPMRGGFTPTQENSVAYEHQHHPMRGGFTPTQERHDP